MRPIIFCMIVMLLPGAAANASQPCRQGFLDIDSVLALSGGPTVDVGVADVNGDGKPDLIVPEGGQYFVFLNRGAGAFEPLPPALDPSANSLVFSARDMNGDGKVDLLFSGPAVALGHGDGTFDRAVSFKPNSQETSYPIFADLDGDGILDAVYRGLLNPSISVLRGAADGTFSTMTTNIAFGAHGSDTFLLAGDFDGDGRIDFAEMPLGQPFITIWWNDGDFHFSGQAVSLATSTPRLIAADLDGLGHPQLVATSGSSLVVITADKRTVKVDYVPIAPYPVAVAAAADLDGDGRIDLVSDYPIPAVFWGVGRREFTAPDLYSIPDATRVQIADLDGDGRPDILGRQVHDILPITRARRDTRALDAPRMYIANTDFSEISGNGIAADFNGDGKIDVVTSAGELAVNTLLGDGHGGFGPPKPSGAVGAVVATGDFDGDGIPDLVTQHSGPTPVNVYFGMGDGTFAKDHLELPGLPMFASDGGKALLVRAGNLVQEVRFTKERTVASSETIQQLVNYSSAVATGSANGQNYIAVFDDPAHSTVALYLRTAGGYQKTTLSIDSYPTDGQRPFLADLNGDGKIDLVAGYYIFINGPSGFRHTGYLDGPAYLVADADGDGAPDIVTKSIGSIAVNPPISVWHNDGSGNFTLRWRGNVASAYPFVADLDGDGRPELGSFGHAVEVIPAACVQPRIRIAQITPSYANSPVEFAITAIPGGGGAIEHMVLEENGAVIGRNYGQRLFSTLVLTLYPSLGTHTYTLAFDDTNVQSTFTVNTTPPPPRRRAAGH